MRRVWPSILTIILTLFLLAALIASQSNALKTKLYPKDSDSSITTSQIWFPEPEEDIGPLNGIRVVGPDDVWVVGQTRTEVINGSADTTKALIAHWDGKSWRTLATFGDGEHNFVLSDIAIISPDDVWAVGKRIRTDNTTGIYGPLAVHWNGKEWSIVSTPSGQSSIGSLNVVVALASDDIWAAGSGLIHWNGKEWKSQTMPGEHNYFQGIDLSAISANDIWAASDDSLLHWDGQQWSISFTNKGLKDMPYAGLNTPLLFSSIRAISKDDVWALGSINIPTNCGGTSSYTFHWDGSGWKEQGHFGVPPFVGCGGGDFIQEIEAMPSGEVWGFSAWGKVVQWDGTDWTHFDCPSEGSDLLQYSPDYYSQFTDMAEVAKGELWITSSRGVPDNPMTRSTDRWHSTGWVLRPYLGICPTPTLHPTELPLATFPLSNPTWIDPVSTGVPVPVATFPAPTLPTP